jgi:hypothetical protein
MMSPDLGRVCALGLLLLSSLAIGCTPKIGRNCSNSLECSLQGSRICDRTQPHGYCTIAGCEEGTCPSEAVCVKFSPNDERLAVTYCLAKCDDTSDCRGDDGYHCLSQDSFGSKGDAKVLGSSGQKFCALRVLPPQSRGDFAPEEPVDAGAAADATAGDAAMMSMAPSVDAASMQSLPDAGVDAQVLQDAATEAADAAAP